MFLLLMWEVLLEQSRIDLARSKHDEATSGAPLSNIRPHRDS